MQGCILKLYYKIPSIYFRVTRDGIEYPITAMIFALQNSIVSRKIVIGSWIFDVRQRLNKYI